MALQTICDVCRQPITEPRTCSGVVLTTDAPTLGDIVLTDVCLACWDEIKDVVLSKLAELERKPA